MSFWHLRTLKGMVNSPEIWVAKRRHKADDFWKGVAKKNSGAYLQSWGSSRKELSTYQAILRSYSTISTGWNRSKPELCHPLLLGQTFSYWCLAGNFREWSQSSLVIIIPATPSNPSIPYVKRTSKFTSGSLAIPQAIFMMCRRPSWDYWRSGSTGAQLRIIPSCGTAVP
jgi:hypothetical protein